MTWWRSATGRSVALVALLPVLLAVLGVRVVQNRLQARLLDEAATRLAAEVSNFEALYDQRRVIAVRQAMEFRGLQDGSTGQVYLLEDRNGVILGGNLTAWPEMVARQTDGFAPAEPQLVSLMVAKGDLRRPYLVDARTLRGGFPMLVGVSLAPMQQTLGDMRRVFALFGAIMLATGLIAAALVAFRAHRRLEHVNSFLTGIGGDSGVAERLTDTGGDEYARLAAHVNDMLDRIAHLVQAHRRLGNAVAHEMRTPLGRIQTRLTELDLPDDRRTELDDEIRAMIRLFDSLLSIAEMDAKAGNTAGLTPIDLSSTVTQIADLYDPVADEAGRTLKHDVVPGLRILGDQGLVAQLLSNLIENGLKYTRPGDSITISLTGNGQHACLAVRDTGPGIDAALRENIFAPFARGTQSGSAPGHGLGLALVQAIALRHGAQLRLPEGQAGFALEIRFLLFKD